MLTKLAERRSDAFQYLIETEKDKILNICYRFVNNSEDAEDLAQETFVEVYRSISEFREASSLSTWIYRIAISKSLNFIRNQNRLKRRGTMTKPIESDDEVIQIPAPDSTDPHEMLEQKERQSILRQALDSLPENQRIAFILSKYDEVSYQEIAAILKTSVPAIESLVHRAKSNLQKKLYNYYKNHLQK